VPQPAHQYTALIVATSGSYAHTFGKPGSAALTGLFVGMQHNGYVINSMFFGLWLLPLGWLVIKSGYFPKVLGVLLILGCFAYVADLFTDVLVPALAPSLGAALIVPAGLSELSFLLWLLLKAVRVPDAPVPILARASS
jgi:hypothetical protein